LKGNTKEKINALQAQLKFRKNILKQKHPDMKIFNLSKRKPNGRYEKLTIDALKKNIMELVQSAARIPTAEIQTSGVPLLVGKVIDHTFADKVYRGEVLGVVPGFPEWYNVKYDGDEALYVYNLLEDCRRGDVKMVVSK